MRSNFLTTAFQQLSNEFTLRRRNSASAEFAVPLPSRPRLMCILAHPDDEALCVGGTLAKYAAHSATLGNETYYRVFTRVNSSSSRESDLFQGIAVNVNQANSLSHGRFA